MSQLAKISRITQVAMWVGIWLAATSQASTAGVEFESTPLQLNTALIVPDELIVGPGYKLDAVAMNDGFNNTYIIETNFGHREATSDYQLARSIQEIHALNALDAMSRSSVFGDAMKGGALSAYEGGKSLVTAPVETTKGAVQGVGRWMGNIGRAARSKDPYQENAFSSAVGWAGTRRAFALELGVDPYTDWEPLQEALTSVAKAAFAGGITVGAAMGAVTGDGSFGTLVEVTSMTDDMNAMLLDNPAEILTKLNTDKLKAIGVPDSTIKPFMVNYNYTPMEKSLLVEALVQMKDAKGRELFIEQATAAPDKIIARFMQQRAQMMSEYHNNKTKVNFVSISGFVWMKTQKGQIIGTFPADYLAWISETQIAVAAAAKESSTKPEIWLEGSASPAAREALTSAGWTVKDRVALITGNPLQDATAASAGMGAALKSIGIIAP
jgi:hypothetical protein